MHTIIVIIVINEVYNNRVPEDHYTHYPGVQYYSKTLFGQNGQSNLNLIGHLKNGQWLTYRHTCTHYTQTHAHSHIRTHNMYTHMYTHVNTTHRYTDRQTDKNELTDLKSNFPLTLTTPPPPSFEEGTACMLGIDCAVF